MTTVCVDIPDYRKRLSTAQATVLHVAPNGDDSRPLLDALNPATPVKSLQRIWNDLYQSFDCSHAFIVIEMDDGVYDGPPVGAFLQISDDLLGLQSLNRLEVRSKSLDHHAVVLRPAPPINSAFLLNQGARLQLSHLTIDSELAAGDQISFGDAWLGLADIAFKNCHSVPGFSSNNISISQGGQCIVYGDLWFDGGMQQAGFYISADSHVYFNTNGGTGLIACHFLNSPDYSEAAFYWLTDCGSINAQGVGYTGSFRGRRAVVKGSSTLDLGLISRWDIPGTLPAIADGASGGAILEDARGELEVWDIPVGTVPCTALQGRVTLRQLLGYDVVVDRCGLTVDGLKAQRLKLFSSRAFQPSMVQASAFQQQLGSVENGTMFLDGNAIKVRLGGQDKTIVLS